MPDDTRADYERLIGELRGLNAGLMVTVELLQARVAVLEKAAGQDSSNSSKPPSSDGVGPRKKRAERRAEARVAGRRPGKQPGSPGAHLRRRDPDQSVVHAPVCCGGCGTDMEAAVVVGTEVRQVIDLIPARVHVSEHVVQRRRCVCGHETAGVFPEAARAPVCWGPEVRALAVYLMDRQHLPVMRCAELLSDVLGAPVSAGWLCGVQLEAADRLEPFMDVVRAQLAVAAVLCADETGTALATGKVWVHTLATGLLTLLVAHPKRGVDAMRDMGILEGYEGTVVHDGWKSYETIGSFDHAQCGAHFLRHLDAAAEVVFNKDWAGTVRACLLAARAAAEIAADAGHRVVPKKIAAAIRADYDRAVTAAFGLCPAGPLPRRRGTGGWLAWQRDTYNLASRLRNEQDQILACLTDTRVPFTNNMAERALRMVKIHDKISGTFRSEDHLTAFVTVRSYLQTAGKHGINLLDVLRQLFTTGPWTPPQPAPA